MMESKYKGLRIAHVAGQGAEGCGVQRTSAEMMLWAEKTGAIVDYYAYNRKYTRSDVHDMPVIQFGISKKKKDVGLKGIKETAEYINENYDIVMFMNYPNAKTDPAVYKAFYEDFYEVIQKPKKAVYIHEIRGAQYNRLAYIVPMIVNADIVFHFDTTSDLSKLIDKIGLQKIGDRMQKYTLWMNFDDLDTWRQKYKHKKTKGVSSVTRWSSSKNVRRTIDIMDEVQQRHEDWNCEIHGIERSMGAKIDVLDYEKTIYVNPNGKKNNEELGCVNVSGPVDRNEGITINAKHMFATAFWSMPKDPQNYGNRMEYTQIEIIGVGTIPILDKHWGEHNHTRDGRRYIDIPYSAIYTDGTDIKDVVDELDIITNDPIKAQKYLDTSYDLVVQEFGADTIIPEAVDAILSISKNTNQLSVTNICEKFVNVSFADEIRKLEKEGKQPVFSIDAFENANVKYLEDSKEVLVKKIKKQVGGKVKNLF